MPNCPMTSKLTELNVQIDFQLWKLVLYTLYYGFFKTFFFQLKNQSKAKHALKQLNN